MRVTKWNILEGLKTQEAIVEFVIAACETPDDKDDISSSIAVAMEAIKLYGIKMATDEEMASLAEDAAAIKNGTPITREVPLTVLKDGGTNDVRESA